MILQDNFAAALLKEFDDIFILYFFEEFPLNKCNHTIF